MGRSMATSTDAQRPATREGRGVSPGSAVALRLIQAYRLALSPFLPPSCRYAPTCSEYWYDAIQTYGLLRGGWLGVKRLARCHPFHAGGVDPVPEPPLAGEPARRPDRHA